MITNAIYFALVGKRKMLPHEAGITPLSNFVNEVKKVTIFK